MKFYSNCVVNAQKRTLITYMYIAMCIFWKILYIYSQKFGVKLNLVDWRTAWATAKLKSAKISYSHNIQRICMAILYWNTNLNLPIRLRWPQPPNLIPANISGCTICDLTMSTCGYRRGDVPCPARSEAEDNLWVKNEQNCRFRHLIPLIF